MYETILLHVITTIPGPKGPGNNIDTYLQPLVKELQELWEHGIETFNAYKKESFQLHAALMWTINDFPAYGMLFGWMTMGKLDAQYVWTVQKHLLLIIVEKLHTLIAIDNFYLRIIHIEETRKHL